MNNTCIHVSGQQGAMFKKQSNKSHLSTGMYIHGVQHYVSMDIMGCITPMCICMSHIGQIIHCDAYGWVATNEQCVAGFRMEKSRSNEVNPTHLKLII
jgi:hypothetical protein